MRGLITVLIVVYASLSGCMDFFGDDELEHIDCNGGSRHVHESGGSSAQDQTFQIQVHEGSGPIELGIHLMEGKRATVILTDPMGVEKWSVEATEHDPQHFTQIKEHEEGKWLLETSRAPGTLRVTVEC